MGSGNKYQHQQEKPISLSQLNELLVKLMVISKLLKHGQPWFVWVSPTPQVPPTPQPSQIYPLEQLQLKVGNDQMDLIGRIKHSNYHLCIIL